ncbi:MAG: sulfotransferase family protein [Nodularia sp. (in: Bacteria)]|nr:MAG: sulfotransferase family protein [Nodularia sp. (in: cyanobacteria)]
MAISHRHKFIFVHIPKCGGTSIEKALCTFTKLDLMNPRLLSEEEIKEKNLLLGGSLHRLERHLSAIEIKTLIEKQEFEDYFKFSIVRNPFSRLVSFYNFVLKNKNPDHTKLQVKLVLNSVNFKDFVTCALQTEQMDLFFNQYKYICDETQNNLMNFTGKLENLSEDFNYGIKTIRSREKFPLRLLQNFPGFKKPTLPHINLSKSVDYREYYDNELREKVEQACEKDLYFFDYQF